MDICDVRAASRWRISILSSRFSMFAHAANLIPRQESSEPHARLWGPPWACLQDEGRHAPSVCCFALRAARVYFRACPLDRALALAGLLAAIKTFSGRNFRKCAGLEKVSRLGLSCARLASERKALHPGALGLWEGCRSVCQCRRRPMPSSSSLLVLLLHSAGWIHGTERVGACSQPHHSCHSSELLQVGTLGVDRWQYGVCQLY
jgi:hypothetical protein